ncbi:MAG TPA: aspartate/glutamate racemase family protein [Candidatus Paceibacterota bacterium]|nr:aspartate/glutamate racemase family protein [Candidatus Paceibacterota bacterium]
MIGIFDSGSGGLTVAKAIRARMPSADILYFGDIKNAPYGERPRAELSQLTIEGLSFLKSRGASRIVSACNSVSASLAVSLFDALTLAPADLIEMVGPTVSCLRGSEARLVLAATPATIDSRIYQDAFAMLGKEITALPLPGLAGAIEAGKSEAEIERIIRAAFKGIAPGSFDALVLACTHYPLASGAFRAVIGEGPILFDPAEAVAARVEQNWWPQEVGEGSARLLISKESAPFRQFAAAALGGALEIKVLA